MATTTQNPQQGPPQSDDQVNIKDVVGLLKDILRQVKNEPVTSGNLSAEATAAADAYLAIRSALDHDNPPKAQTQPQTQGR